MDANSSQKVAMTVEPFKSRKVVLVVLVVLVVSELPAV